MAWVLHVLTRNPPWRTGAGGDVAGTCCYDERVRDGDSSNLR